MGTRERVSRVGRVGAVVAVVRWCGGAGGGMSRDVGLDVVGVECSKQGEVTGWVAWAGLAGLGWLGWLGCMGWAGWAGLCTTVRAFVLQEQARLVHFVT